MKKILLFGFPLLFTGLFLMRYTGGPPAGYTGSPGDRNSCTACHAAANTYNPTVNLTHNIPASGYVPGATYQLTLSVQSASRKHGFQLTAEDAQGQKQGTFQSLDANTQTAGNNQYIQHTSAGTSQTSWTFNWTAPASSGTNVTFYAAVNATNADNTSNGDTPVLFNLSVQQAGVAADELPGIRLYPNPVEDVLKAEIPQEYGFREIIVYDLRGKEWARFDRLPADLSRLPRGTYIARLVTGKGIASLRFVKK
ncbi:MAG: T9SS type A sorting domain-containing protein [Chlorobi bacterium]|nr:T9SS type A sorting domain-containing protein [Chlorobiota bacterium]